MLLSITGDQSVWFREMSLRDDVGGVLYVQNERRPSAAEAWAEADDRHGEDEVLRS